MVNGKDSGVERKIEIMSIQKLLTRNLNLSEAAFVLGVAPNTLRKLAKEFELESEHPHGQRRFCPDKVERLHGFLAQKKMKKYFSTKRVIY